MKNTIIIYHRVDYDGIASCLVVKKYFSQQENNTINCHGWNYGDEIPNVENYETIVLVDVSFPPAEMLKLKSSGKDLIWIDHHQTAINDSIELKYDNIPGIREEENISACELAWNYFFKTDSPRLIKYLSAYDVWNKNRFDWDKEVLPVQYGLKSRYGLSISKFDVCMSDDELTDLIKEGKLILDFQKKSWKSQVKTKAIDVLVAEKYKAICMLTPQGGSLQFESVIDNYDLFIVINKSIGDNYFLCLYSEPDKIPEFNCGVYVRKKFGNGGGHKTSCGCQISLDQVFEILKTKKL